MNVADYQSQAQFTSEFEQGHQPNVVGLRGLIVFTLALVATILVVFGVLGLVMRGFSTEEHDLQSLKPPRFEDKSGLFPSPRLQPDPNVELVTMKKEELGRLNGYGWVDQKAGVAHIPIDRAIDILTKSGLPRIEAKAVEPGGPVPATQPDPQPDAKRKQDQKP